MGQDTGAAELSDPRGYDDRDQLAKLGKKEVLKRNFGFWSIMSLSATVLITWEGSLVLFAQGLTNGGAGGIIYTFIAIWIGNLSVFAALCELVSMAPTAAGQYHWVYMLAPESSRRLLSFVTGWLTVAGWQGSAASASYLCGGMIQALILMTNQDYVPERWHSTLLFIAVVAVCTIVNAGFNRLLPKIELVIMVLHIAGFVGILITMAAMGKHGDTASVFTTFANGGNWPSQGISVLVGMIGNAFAFVGADAAFHLSEEIHNPSIAIPKSIITAILINGTLGFAMLIAVLFSLANLTGEPQFIFPMLDIFYGATGSIAAGAAIGSVVLTLAICSTMGLFVSSSRVFWSFARDHGLPFWRTLSKVNTYTESPLWSIGTTSVIAALLSLINIGSDVALNDVLSLSISALYISYLLALVFFLYRRTTGAIRMPSLEHGNGKVVPGNLIWGPWRINGVLGILNNVFACMYLVLVLFFSFWPPARPVETPAAMNYSVLVTGAVAIFSVGYYYIWAKRDYEGPIIEV